MAERVLLDTGVLVALVNAGDPDHLRCRKAWETLRVSLISVEGVVVEAAHLLRKHREGARAAIDLVLAAKVEFEATHGLLLRASALMEQYRNVPMDLVDALLVATAEKRRVSTILTLDRRGFRTYRLFGKTYFTVLPE